MVPLVITVYFWGQNRLKILLKGIFPGRAHSSSAGQTRFWQNMNPKDGVGSSVF